jgi:hypothetical protein
MSNKFKNIFTGYLFSNLLSDLTASYNLVNPFTAATCLEVNPVSTPELTLLIILVVKA